jgi:radical SAM protein with 4Fe4S-binding SPASM domain
MDEILQEIKPNPTYSEIRSKDVVWPKHRSDEYWEYRKNWSEYPKKMHVSDFPLHLDIETTSYCNLECVMCPRTIQMKEGIGYLPENEEEFPMDLYKKIIDEGSDNGLCSIKFQYLSEPLADSKIIERIKYAKDKGIMDLMFNTNATLLTEKMAYDLLESGLDDIFFSIDSIIPEKYNKIRVGADYDQVIENIKSFMKIKNEGNYKHVQTRTSMVVLPGTKQSELDEYVKFWLPIVGIVGFDEWIDHSTKRKELNDYNPNFICAQPFQRLFIMHEGTCTPCCVDATRGYPLGHVQEQSITEIWHGEKLTKMREAQTSGNYRSIEICKKCYIPFSKSDGGTTPEIM